MGTIRIDACFSPATGTGITVAEKQGRQPHGCEGRFGVQTGLDVGPSVDDRVLVEVVHGSHDAVLEFLLGCDADVAQDGAGELREEALDQIEPGAVLGCEGEREAAGRSGGEPRFRLLGDVRGMIVEDQTDRRMCRIGRVEKLELPKPGHWVRQGQRALGFLRGDEKAEMVSPIEGEVVEVNADVVNDPTLLRKDPYGKGWLMTVFVPDEDSTSRNLLPTNLVSGWMREAVERLYGMQPALAGAVAADGGRPAEDLSVAIPDKPWTELTSEFFLTC